jgi:addiction module HigA family antidote
MPNHSIQTPSEVLTSLMDKYQLNPYRLAREIKVPQGTIRLIVIGKSKITVSIACRLAKYFGKTPEYWLKLQMQYDLAEAARDKDMTKDLKGIQKVKKPVSAKKAVRAKAPVKKTAKKTKAAKPAAPKKAAKTTKAAARVSKPAVKPESKKRGRKPRAETPVKPVEPRKKANSAEPKKRERKPKAAPVIQPPQEKTFVPNVILIKQQDKPAEFPPPLENIDPLTKE